MTLRVGLVAVLWVAAALANALFAPLLVVAGGRPDFVVLAVIAVALSGGAGFGMVYGFAAGLLVDLVSGSGLVGLSALVGLFLGYGCGLLRPERGARGTAGAGGFPGPVVFGLLAGALTFAAVAVDVLVELALAGPPLWAPLWAEVAAATSAWNLVVGLAASAAVRLLSARVRQRPALAGWTARPSTPAL